MKVKEWVDGYLVLDGDVVQGAEEAFNELRYVEAFSLLQAQIDALMIFIYQMHAEKSVADTERLHFDEKYTYPKLRDYINKNKILDSKQIGDLERFYQFRIRTVHLLIMYGYQPYKRYRISKREAIEVFDLGKEVVKLLDSKTVQIGLSSTTQFATPQKNTR